MYFVNFNGQAVGPYSREQLAAMLRAGQLTAASQVCEQSSQQWVALGAMLAASAPQRPMPPMGPQPMQQAMLAQPRHAPRRRPPSPAQKSSSPLAPAAVYTVFGAFMLSLLVEVGGADRATTQMTNVLCIVGSLIAGGMAGSALKARNSGTAAPGWSWRSRCWRRAPMRSCERQATESPSNCGTRNRRHLRKPSPKA